MGACSFIVKSAGKDANEAFDRAVEAARWESGHGGYTGTIAEKYDFTMIRPPAELETERQIHQWAERLIEEDDDRIADKWGPAGCAWDGTYNERGEKCFIFFGWASS